MPTATVVNTFEIGKATLELARRSTLKLVADIPAEHHCHQPVPKANHATWVLGHLANTDNFFLTSLGGRDPVIDKSWGDLFGMGSEPTGDPGRYPSLTEVKAGCERARAALIDWFASMDDQKLQSPLPDQMKGFAPNYAGVMGTLAWHEGLHAGQLSAVRRSLGLPYALEV
ncbi:MAG: DinB family protein [Planctomycetes bacterium]|nr:DinB family protein [Planctomycetota bacterium]